MRNPVTAHKYTTELSVGKAGLLWAFLRFISTIVLGIAVQHTFHSTDAHWQTCAAIWYSTFPRIITYKCSVIAFFQGESRANPIVRGRNTPWMGCRYIAGQDVHTHAHSHSYLGMFRVVNSPTTLFLKDERKAENLQETHGESMYRNSAQTAQYCPRDPGAVRHQQYPLHHIQYIYIYLFIYCEQYILHVEYRETVLLLRLTFALLAIADPIQYLLPEQIKLMFP